MHAEDHFWSDGHFNGNGKAWKSVSLGQINVDQNDHGNDHWDGHGYDHEDDHGDDSNDNEGRVNVAIKSWIMNTQWCLQLRVWVSQ